MKRKATLVFIYNSFKDPLFQNLVLSYLKTLSTKGSYTFHIITFEQKEYSISNAEKLRIHQELKEYNIDWYPLQFHTGRFLILKKLYDLLTSLFIVIRIRIVHNTKVIFAFANVSGAFSIVLSKLLRMKFLIYSYEPHADFQIELGLWSKKSLPYRILSSLERYVGINGDYILTGTQYMVDDLKKSGAKGKVFRAPTSVDEHKFSFDIIAREKVRHELGISDKHVLLYLGKFGGLYYSQETALLCKLLKERIDKFFFLIVTPNRNEEVAQWFQQAGLSESEYLVAGPFTDVVPYISAVDIGLNAIPPSPAQKYRSPTKVAEYLLCGIPYITCRGVSEDDIVAEDNNVGVVLDKFDKPSVKKIYPKVIELLTEDKAVQRERCRKVGISYRGKSNIDSLLQRIYDEL